MIFNIYTEKQPRAICECPDCGYDIECIWGGQEIKFTGKCIMCGTIIMFANKDDVIKFTYVEAIVK